MHSPSFSSAVRDGFLELLKWRRDVRSFRPTPLPEGTLERLIAAACLSPSVGLSEPWRFVIVDDPGRRAAVRASFERANAAALSGQDQSRRALYARLKLAGLDDAPAQMAAFADPSIAQGHELGRATMPQTIEYSVAIAIHTIWLAARLDGIGLGWVSILEPGGIAEILGVPPEWRFVGYLCLGYPVMDDDRPLLQRLEWETRRDPSCCILRR